MIPAIIQIRKSIRLIWHFLLIFAFGFIFLPTDACEAQVYSYLTTTETTTTVHAIGTCVTHLMNDMHKAWVQVRITSPSGRSVTVNTGNPTNALSWPRVTATASADLVILYEDGIYTIAETDKQYCNQSQQISNVPPPPQENHNVLPFCSIVSVRFNPTHLKIAGGSADFLTSVATSYNYNGPFELIGTIALYGGDLLPTDFTWSGTDGTYSQTPGTTVEREVGHLLTSATNAHSGTVTAQAILSGYSGAQVKVGVKDSVPAVTGATVDLK